ncbi:unnamed protein product [Lactuca saligna]|uniref:Uncharacterized protein n=1 Tax=Lactuca saligna TaxID=75948 RepID=A0AA36E5G2_LACSI|nr:unnamed protein product [Lactuca saligna]
MVMKKNAEKIVLENKTMEDKLKNLKENKPRRKELKEQAKRDEELDALNALKAKFDAEDKFFEEILASKKVMFPEWIVDQIQEEAINNPNLYWLETQTSFSITNDLECQLDFLISAKVFQF